METGKGSLQNESCYTFRESEGMYASDKLVVAVGDEI
jgi:hypothetical protein